MECDGYESGQKTQLVCTQMCVWVMRCIRQPRTGTLASAAAPSTRVPGALAVQSRVVDARSLML